MFQEFLNSKNKLLCSILIILFLFGLFVRIKDMQQIDLYPDVVVDLTRVESFKDQIAVTGQEYKGGINLTEKRTPGGFYYYMLYFFFKVVGLNYEGLHYLNILSHVLSAFLLFYSFLRYVGLIPSLLAGVFFSCGFSYLEFSQKLLSPTTTIFFSILCFFLLIKLILDKNEIYLPLLILSACMATQIHLSYSVYFFLSLFSIIRFKVRISKKMLLISLFIFMTMYAPYLFVEKARSLSFANPIIMRFGEGFFIRFWENWLYLFEIIFDFMGFLPNPSGQAQSSMLHLRNGVCDAINCEYIKPQITSVITSLGLILFSISFFFPRKTSSSELERFKRFHSFIVFNVILALAYSMIIIQATTTFAGHWRYLFLFPFLLGSIAIGGKHCLSFLNLTSKRKNLEIIFAIFIILSISFNFYYWESSKRIIHYRYTLFSKVIDLLQLNFGFTKEEVFSDKVKFLANYDFLYNNKHDWVIQNRETIWYVILERMYSIKKTVSETKPFDGCVIVFFEDQHPNKEYRNYQESELTKLLSYSIGKKIQIDKLPVFTKTVRDVVTIAGYKTNNGKCFTNFSKITKRNPFWFPDKS